MIELKNIQEFEQWFTVQDKIYLYGAGKVCRKLLRKIHHIGLYNTVQNILLSDTNPNFKTLYGINIIKFNRNEISPEIPILLAVVAPP